MTTKFAAFFLLSFPYSATTSKFLLLVLGVSLTTAFASVSVTPFTASLLVLALCFDFEPLVPTVH
jgi:hypothetical protein